MQGEYPTQDFPSWCGLVYIVQPNLSAKSLGQLKLILQINYQIQVKSCEHFILFGPKFLILPYVTGSH